MIPPGFQLVALVTGGAVRLGRDISLGLAEAGYDLVVHYRSSRGPAEEVARAVEALGRRCVLHGGDLTDPAVPGAMVEAARAAYGRLDLLVNSAASFDARPLAEVDAPAWDAVMDLNVRAPHLLVRAAEGMLRSSRGAVVNVLDLSAFQPWSEHAAHAVSKAALAQLTRVQARALAPEVRVNAVAPGAVLPPEGYPEERLEALRSRTPLGTLGTPEDVVRAVVFLAGAAFVTGQILAVEGGRLLGPTGPPPAEG
ncbi:MAG: SDR family oxidoreductase [Gemmatimonadetes bacterium]|nr:SDR family oxidoreductase [Gemmatimonadota bacterium]